MENKRLEEETQAQVDLIVYNWNKRINETLANGSPVDILQVISAYNLYMQTNANILRDTQNKN